MSKHTDKDFEDFLAGHSPVSDLYRKGDGSATPETLDKLILKQAHSVVETRHRSYSPFSGRWVVPASLAAVIVISMTVIIQLPVHESAMPELISEIELEKKSQHTDNLPQLQQERRQAGSHEKEVAISTEKPTTAQFAAPAPAQQDQLAKTKSTSGNTGLAKQEESPASRSKYPAETAAPVANIAAEKPGTAQQIPSQPAAAVAQDVAKELQYRTETSRVESPQPRLYAPAEEAPPVEAMMEPALEEPPARDEPVEAKAALKEDKAILPAEQWLKKITDLINENSMQLAREEYQRFRKHYPAYTSKAIEQIESAFKGKQ